jgi:hypothetical protein
MRRQAALHPRHPPSTTCLHGSVWRASRLLQCCGVMVEAVQARVAAAIGHEGVVLLAVLSVYARRLLGTQASGRCSMTSVG